MQFTTLFIAAASVAFATASPNYKPKPEPTKAPAPAQQCGNGQVASCCNGSNKDLILGLLTGIDCDVLAANCNEGSVACCPTSSEDNGLINVSGLCVPLTLNL